MGDLNMPKNVRFADHHKGRSMTAEVVDATSHWRERPCRGEPVAQIGDVVIDLYDCSDKIEEFLGDDYAWFTVVAQREKAALVREVDEDAPDGEGEDEDWRILHFLKNRFTDISQVNEWLAAHAIPYRKFLDDTYVVREQVG
jgi:hypothetical protein